MTGPVARAAARVRRRRASLSTPAPAPPPATAEPTPLAGSDHRRSRRAGRRPSSSVDDESAPASGTLFVTDLVFANPNGREGALVLLRDSDELIRF